MNYIKITKNDIANGEGVRVVLWLSGCNHKCKGCHNPQTWDVNSGIPFDEEVEKELFEALDKSYISGITFSGGDPLHENNLEDVLNIVNKIRILLPDKTIWLYSGYTWEEIWSQKKRINTSGKQVVGRTIEQSIRQDILKQCDVFVDGRYIEELKSPSLHWVGSSNQRIWRKNEKGEWYL